MSDLRQQALDTIGRYRALRGDLPDPVKLAAKFSVPLEEAQSWVDAFEPPKPKANAPKPVPRKSRAKPTVGNKLSHFFESLIDSGSLWFAVVIDLILNGIGFYIIGPDPIMKVGMVCVSFIVVLFSVRAWIKRDKLLWLTFAFVASFMDISFVLLATDVQTQNHSVDTELIRLTDQVSKDSSYLESLQNLQLKNGQGYATQINDARLALAKSEQLKSAHFGANPNGEIQMTASKVFTAIPDAAFSGRWDRWIALGLMILVFVGLQLTIISATGVKWNEPENNDRA